MGEEVSNKVVLILALLVVLVVAVSTWLVLNKLSAVDLPSEAPQPKVVYVTETITEGPAPVGRVALSILPPVEEEHKMVDTNKALTILLVVALFVSVFGALSAMNKVDSFQALTGLWGHGTETRAAVNLTITSNLDINFSDDTADFGEGYIVSGFDSCTIGTDGTNSSGCFNFSLPNGFILENIGNRYAAINLTNTNFTNSLLGGTASGYAWMWNDPENDAEDSTCDVTGKSDDIPVEDTWLNLTVANAPYTTAADNWCVKFNYTDSNDEINISIKFHIDQTALARVVSDTWLVTALDAGQ